MTRDDLEDLAGRLEQERQVRLPADEWREVMKRLTDDTLEALEALLEQRDREGRDDAWVIESLPADCWADLRTALPGPAACLCERFRAGTP